MLLMVLGFLGSLWIFGCGYAALGSLRWMESAAPFVPTVLIYWDSCIESGQLR
jgi:hypothetical protein